MNTADLSTVVKRAIENVINDAAREGVNQGGRETRYKQPLIGFLDADDRQFITLREQVNPGHLLPDDILPGAKTVVSFFFPFTPELVRANRNAKGDPDIGWLYAYSHTNALISRTCEQLRDVLRNIDTDDRPANGSTAGAAGGISAGWVDPTHNFDQQTLRSRWSHKSIGYMAGLGRFGLHQMLITPSGCAGRFGSLVLNHRLQPSAPLFPPQTAVCPALEGGLCNACIRACPAGAISPRGVDKRKRFDYLNEIDARCSGQIGDMVDACGKCAVAACAWQIPKKSGTAAD
jgi:epoxyqueuosine reductase QueG